MGKKIVLSNPDKKNNSASSGTVTFNKKKRRLGVLCSRLEFPVKIQYDHKCVMMPPKGRLNGIDENKLGELQTGITFILDKQ